MLNRKNRFKGFVDSFRRSPKKRNVNKGESARAPGGGRSKGSRVWKPTKAIDPSRTITHRERERSLGRVLDIIYVYTK